KGTQSSPFFAAIVGGWFRIVESMSSSSSAAVATCLEGPGGSSSSGLFRSPGTRTLLLCLLLTAVVLVSYNPVTHNGFLTFDDDQYIVDNPHVRAGLTWETVKWAFTTYEEANWHPLTWLSHALDCQLFGLHPAGHHYVNVLLHAANAVLLFLLLQNTTGFRREPDGGRSVCATSDQRRVGGLGSGAEKRVEHAVFSARTVCLRRVRAKRWTRQPGSWEIWAPA